MAAHKGQVSVEQMFITSVGITFVSAMFFLAVLMSADTVRRTEAQDTVERITKSADLVYAMGPGAKTSIEVLVPDSIVLVNISGSRILIRIGMVGGETDVYSHSDGELSGTLTSKSGRQRVTLTVDNSSLVLINSTG